MFGKPVYEKATDAEGNHPNISTWHYDSLGRVIRAVCDGHSYEYVYDAQGNLKEKRSSGRRLVSYAYDRMGQVTEIKDPAGVCTRYEYDILGRRSRIYNDDGLEVRYGYDALNRIRRIHYGNGVETAYAYDGDGNISSLETKAGENILLSFVYQYDGNGNRTVKTGTQAGLGNITSEITMGNNVLNISYRYDVRGQLLEEQRNGGSVCYAYDKAGNRIRKTDAKGGATLYRFNGKNQLIETENHDGKNQFTYDRQGGIVKEENSTGIRLFSYNGRHQQTKVETENGNVQENRYDVENLRFELLENGRRTSFIYHNGELLHEEGGIGQALSGQTSYHLGAGIDALQRGHDLSYYHMDEQLSTAFITGRDGEIQNSYLYDAFGAALNAKEQLQNRIRYTGQQYDDLTGQYYLRARYYNPVLGRFMQEDVYQGDGLNLYVYCRNNPVIYYDPSGYHNKDGAKGKQSTVDLNTAIGRIGEYCGWRVDNGIDGMKEEYFPGPKGNQQGSHRADVTISKEIDGQIVMVRVNTTTDASGNIPDSRERRNAQELDQQISSRNAAKNQPDSLNQIVTISKTDGRINNVDYNDITKPVDPFDQIFSDAKVKEEMINLKGELENLGDEMAAGKTPAQIAKEYEDKKQNEETQEKMKDSNCNS